MTKEHIDTKSVEKLISYLKELYEFYYNDKNNKMGSSFKIKGFSEDDGKAYSHVMVQITIIISNIKKWYDEYNSKISSNANYTFEVQLKEFAWRELKRKVFDEFLKVKDINVIGDLDEAIEQKVEELKQAWRIEEIVQTNWKDFIGVDNDEAYARLIKENENIHDKINKLVTEKRIAEYYGYVPSTEEQISLLLKANPNLNKIIQLKVAKDYLSCE